jgi:NAD(P)-dependent dehydrogenase (short-subunit alcohol dehydrogenase family)
MNAFDFSGQVAIVSGGSGWLGAPMVRALASHGAHVIAVSRSRENAERALADVSGDVTIVSADVTTDAWAQAIADVEGAHGRIDVLVNNAHIGSGGSLRTSSPQQYLDAINLAVVGASTGMNAALSGMKKSVALGGQPSIINISSMYGLVAPDPSNYETEAARNPPQYGAAKAALIQLTRYAAAEFGEHGIRVNAIAPGPFPGIEAQKDVSFIQRLGRRTMLNRVGNPEELTSTLLYLASTGSSFTTGAIIPVDGGWTAW